MSSPTRDYASELQRFLSDLAQEPDREQIISEIEGIGNIEGFLHL